MLNAIINHLLIFSGWSALLLVFALPALESSVFLGFVVPGETAVVVGGFLAYEHRVSFPGVLAAAILGAGATRCSAGCRNVSSSPSTSSRASR